MRLGTYRRYQGQDPAFCRNGGVHVHGFLYGKNCNHVYRCLATAPVSYNVRKVQPRRQIVYIALSLPQKRIQLFTCASRDPGRRVCFGWITTTTPSWLPSTTRQAEKYLGRQIAALGCSPDSVPVKWFAVGSNLRPLTPWSGVALRR